MSKNLCKLLTATVIGVKAIDIDVEVHVDSGLPGFFIVGLPNNAVREGGTRIRAALSNRNYKEVTAKKVTVNLAPADVRKDGAAFDLPIALALLTASGSLPWIRKDLLIAGELALDGRVKSIRGALALAEAARRQGKRGIVVPGMNAAEAALVEDVEVYGVEDLDEAVDLLAGRREIEPTLPPEEQVYAAILDIDYSEVAGQPEARRAAEVAAAGGHNLMLVGPPGSGKTMIARRLPTILPELTMEEAIETTRIYSVAGLLDGRPLVRERPFRAPHHTCSTAGLIGGGGNPRPGEVSLAHNGVLFLDELPEFQRPSLEALRQPLEDGLVTIVRARLAVMYPARLMLAAAMNPCPCGWRGSGVRTCTCGEQQALRYVQRISGPLLDRFDIFVRVQPVETRVLMESEEAESSAVIRARVEAARERQRHRFRRGRASCNAQMTTRQVKHHVRLDSRCKELLESYAAAHALSGRALHRTCKVARSLADLDESPGVTEEHALMALTLQRARWEH